MCCKTLGFKFYLIMGKIKISGVDHYLHENLTWERAVDLYKQENSFLKTRLAQVVDKNTDKAFIALAEYFNNRFILSDEYISDILQDIRFQKNKIADRIRVNPAVDPKIEILQNKLRSEMDRFETEITILKREFNKQLVSYLKVS